jgi:hypothetical protein
MLPPSGPKKQTQFKPNLPGNIRTPQEPYGNPTRPNVK